MLTGSHSTASATFGFYADMVMVMVFASSQLTFLGLFQVMPVSQRSPKVNLGDLLECSIPYTLYVAKSTSTEVLFGTILHIFHMHLI